MAKRKWKELPPKLRTRIVIHFLGMAVILALFIWANSIGLDHKELIGINITLVLLLLLLRSVWEKIKEELEDADNMVVKDHPKPKGP